MVQRGKLSPTGVRRQRIGKKALAVTRVAASLDRRLSVKSGRRDFVAKLPSLRYTFQRWHLELVAGVIVVAVGARGSMMLVEQKNATEARRTAATAQQAAVVKQKQQQACLVELTQKNQDKVGKLTYDQLYGTQCQ